MSDPQFEQNLIFLKERARSLKASGAPLDKVSHAHAVVHMMEMVDTMKPMIFAVVDEGRKNRGKPDHELQVKALQQLVDVTAQLSANLIASLLCSVSASPKQAKTLVGVTIGKVAQHVMAHLSDDAEDVLVMHYDDNGKPKPFDFRDHINN